MEAASLLDRLRAALESAGLHQAVVSHPETLSWLRAFEHVFVVRAGGSEILTQFEHTL
jgi:Xaa-Pro aminopeptidase